MHTGSKLITADSLDLNCIEYAEMHTSDKQTQSRCARMPVWIDLMFHMLEHSDTLG